MEQVMLEQVGAQRKLSPHSKPILQYGSVRTCGPATLEKSIPEGVYPMAGTPSGVVHEELQYVGRTHVEEVCGELCEEWEKCAGVGEECEVSSL